MSHSNYHAVRDRTSVAVKRRLRGWFFREPHLLSFAFRRVPNYTLERRVIGGKTRFEVPGSQYPSLFSRVGRAAYDLGPVWMLRPSLASGCATRGPVAAATGPAGRTATARSIRAGCGHVCTGIRGGGARVAALRCQVRDDSSKAANFQLHYNAGQNHERTALALASMWRDVLGIEVDLVPLEWKVYLSQHREPCPDPAPFPATLPRIE